jgi:hypothetical protein
VRPDRRCNGSVKGGTGIYEVTWATDGRATFEYGDPVVSGASHVIWRQVGAHAIFKQP